MAVLDRLKARADDDAHARVTRWWLVSCAVGLALLGVGALTPDPLTVGGLGVAIFGIGTTLLCWRVSGSLGVCAVIAAYAAQGFWVALQSAIFDTRALGTTSLPFDLRDNPLRVLWSLVIVSVVGLGTALVARALFGKRRFEALIPVRSLGDLSSRQKVPLQAFTLLLAALPLVYWAAAFGHLGTFGYPLRVTVNCLTLTPIAAGYYGRLFPRTRPVWATTLTISLVIAAILGERGGGFTPIAYYVAGYLLTLSGRRLRLSLLSLAIAAPIALYVLAQLGDVRNRLGRGGLELLTEDRATEVATSLSNPSESGDLSGDAVFAREGTGRMIVWPNFAATILSPEYVPYRGLTSWLEDIEGYRQVGFVMTTGREEVFDRNLGNAAARNYGFLVDEHTDVEFGVLGDGWSRAGPWGLIVVTSALAFILALSEVLVERLAGTNRVLLVVLLTVVLRVAYFSQILPALELVRMLILDTGFSLLLFVIARPLVAAFVALRLGGGDKSVMTVRRDAGRS